MGHLIGTDIQFSIAKLPGFTVDSDVICILYCRLLEAADHCFTQWKRLFLNMGLAGDQLCIGKKLQSSHRLQVFKLDLLIEVHQPGQKLQAVEH